MGRRWPLLTSICHDCLHAKHQCIANIIGQTGIDYLLNRWRYSPERRSLEDMADFQDRLVRLVGDDGRTVKSVLGDLCDSVGQLRIGEPDVGPVCIAAIEQPVIHKTTREEEIDQVDVIVRWRCCMLLTMFIFTKNGSRCSLNSH